MNRWIPLEHHDPECPEISGRPMMWLDVCVIGPLDQAEARALLDPGADMSVFPKSLLERLGVIITGNTKLDAKTGAGPTEY